MLVQHCYNGNITFPWDKGILTPCKIETVEQIVTKFVTIDYVNQNNPILNLVKSIHGSLLSKWVKNNVLRLFFSLIYVEQPKTDFDAWWLLCLYVVQIIFSKL